MKMKILSILMLAVVACAKSSDQVIETMKAAACKSDSKTFLGYINKDEVLKSLVAYYADGNSFAEVVGAGMALKMSDKIWDNFATEINQGQKSQYCSLAIRAVEKNENHGKYVIEYSTHELYKWELHKNESGFQVVKMTPYSDYMNLNWGANKASVKPKVVRFGTAKEVDDNSATKGLSELQYSNVTLAGMACKEAGFIFFDDRLVAASYFCEFDTDQKIDEAIKKFSESMSRELGNPAHPKPGASVWEYVNTKYTLSKKLNDKKIPELTYIVSDLRIDLEKELKSREVGK